jgi:UV DNA damage endonuclease
MKTLFRLGYVAMSVNVTNSSPSQTMTLKTFAKLENQEAAIHKLERIALSNLHNCLRLLRHNAASDISFFRLSSRLVPLATHERLKGWDYIGALEEGLHELGDFAERHQMRLDFHPDHFVVLNSPKKDVFVSSLLTLTYHLNLLKGMGLSPVHRCVLHVGGAYKNKEQALEQFISNWAYVPQPIQDMVIIENDDKSFTLLECLTLCEKLGLPLVFDYHHHLANHEDPNWFHHWRRVIRTWRDSPHPIKMHISSPKSEKEFRHHADFVDATLFLDFLKKVNGTVPQLDCMIEAKMKDQALFQLMTDLKETGEISPVNGASFYLN